MNTAVLDVTLAHQAGAAESFNTSFRRVAAEYRKAGNYQWFLELVAKLRLVV